jgi:aspartyl protease family protein
VQFVDKGARTPTAMAAAPEAVSAPANSRSVTLKRADNGHFHVEARVDGRRINFMVDTGASHIALRESDAAHLGIRPTPRDYTVRVATANGEGRAARAELRVVEVGDIAVRDLVALVHPDQALDMSLLGMSFLARVRWTYDRGKLVLER